MFGITTSGEAASLRAWASAHRGDDYGTRCMLLAMCKPGGKREPKPRKLMNIGHARPKAKGVPTGKSNNKRKVCATAETHAVAGPAKVRKSCLRVKTARMKTGNHGEYRKYRGIGKPRVEKIVRFARQVVERDDDIAGVPFVIFSAAESLRDMAMN